MSAETIVTAVVMTVVVASLAPLGLLAMMWWSLRRADAASRARRRAHELRLAGGGDGADGEAGGGDDVRPERGPVKSWRTKGHHAPEARRRLLRVPVPAEIHDQLWQLAQKDGVTMTDVIADSVVLYRLVRHVGAKRPWPPKHAAPGH